VADSLKLAVAFTIICVLAWSGRLGTLQAPLAGTAAFLLYYLWPAMSILTGLLTTFFAVRDARRGRRRQAIVAVVLSLGIVTFSWMQFHGWE
jgi:hypothetical protein